MKLNKTIVIKKLKASPLSFVFNAKNNSTQTNANNPKNPLETKN